MKKSKKITGIAGATLIGTTVFYLKTRRKAKKERTKKSRYSKRKTSRNRKSSLRRKVYRHINRDFMKNT